MEVKTIQDILQFQKEFTQKVERLIALARKGKAPSPELAVKEKEEIRARLKARLDAATEAQERAARRYEDGIRSHSMLISRLDKEIEEDRKSLQRAGVKPAKEEGKKGRAAKPKGMGEG
jgi:hypothetical protein